MRSRSAALHLLKNAPRMDISEISAAVKGISEYKVDIQDYLDIMAVWYPGCAVFQGDPGCGWHHLPGSAGFHPGTDQQLQRMKVWRRSWRL